MPSFVFRGFETGSAVNISVTQGAASQSASVPAWGEQGGGNGIISANVLTPLRVVAPAAVWLTADGWSGFSVSGHAGIYEPHFHEVTHYWETDDTGIWDKPENMVAEWKDKGFATGPHIAHVYDTPGTFTPSVTGFDSTGESGTGMAPSITVVDADTVYTDTSTICIALDGNFAGAPVDCQQVTSISGMQSAINEQNNTPTRILFKRGEDYADCTINCGFDAVEYVGAWGTGNRPILRAERFTGADVTMLSWFGNSNSQQVIITDLDMRGDWDPIGETGYVSQVPFDVWGLDVNDTFLTVYNCRFANLTRIDISHTNGGRPAHAFFVSNEVVDWLDYGLFQQRNSNPNSQLGIVGNKITQNVMARDGFNRQQFSLYGNRHGPVRFEHIGSFHCAANDLFSNAGWSEITPGQAIQACIRINTFGGDALDSFGNMERNVMEGGAEVVNMQGENSGTPETPGNYVFDKNIFVGNSKSAEASNGGCMMTAAYGGTTIRNCFFYMPDSPHYHDAGNNSAYPISFHQHNPISGNQNEPVNIYCNTILNGRGAANDIHNYEWRIDNTSHQFNNITIENNIIAAPTINTPVKAADAPLGSSALPGITLRYPGVIEGADPITGSMSVANGDFHAIPYPYGTTKSDWTPHAGSDTLHTILVGGTVYHGGAGHIEIDVSQTSEMRIYNRSGAIWNGSFELKPDMTSQITADAAYATPPNLPLARPEPGSEALNDGDVGLKARDDLFGNLRPAIGNDRGAILGG